MTSSLSEELLKLEILKCKLCRNRLRYPILYVSAFGNVCGSCYSRNPNSLTRRNTDVEEVLSKMYVQCNFAKRGCKYEEYFRNTCDHEEICFFRDRICPFSYQRKCRNTLIPDIINHIYEKHADCILTVEDNSVMVRNPVIPNQDVFYLLKDSENHYLLRMMLENDEAFSYGLYYFTNGNCDDREIKFSIRIEDSVLDIKTKDMSAKHEAYISTSEAFGYLKMKRSLFKCLDGTQNVKVVITDKMNDDNKANNDVICSSLTDWFKCVDCDDFSINEFSICFNCYSKKCESCIGKYNTCLICKASTAKNKAADVVTPSGKINVPYHGVDIPQNNVPCGVAPTSRINTAINNSPYVVGPPGINNFSYYEAYGVPQNRVPNREAHTTKNNVPCFDLTSKLKFPCKNTGCDKHIPGCEYETHKVSCPYKQYECVFADTETKCLWKGLYTVLSEHIETSHGSRLNENTLTIKLNGNSSFIIPILKNKVTIKCQYGITGDSFCLKIGTVGPSSLHNLYLWEVHIREHNSPHEITITDACLSFDEATERSINIREYICENQLEFSILVKNKIRVGGNQDSLDMIGYASVRHSIKNISHTPIKKKATRRRAKLIPITPNQLYKNLSDVIEFNFENH